MPIYNRSQLSSGTTGFVATEGYNTTADLGRALYESQLNDMRIFEAVCAADVHQYIGIREGTMLESEIRTLTEASVKGFFKAIGDRLKKFWEKVKQIFRQATAKLSTWVVRDGKVFVALHRKALMSMKFNDVKVPNYRVMKSEFNNFADVKLPDVNLDQAVTTAKGTGMSGSKSLADNLLSDFKDFKLSKVAYLIGDDPIAIAFDEAKEINATSLNVQAMMDNLSTASKYIKDIKKAEKQREKDIHNAIKSLDSVGKKIENDEDGARTELLKVCREYVTLVESTCSKLTKNQIKIIRFSLGQDRRALGYMVGHGTVKENAIFEESAALDDIESLNDEMDSPFEAEITPDVAEIINAANED